ncbi:hypothetical protein BDW22DRAFT_1409577 [Trametopsis cervina]|nr:hypothetical protein BDW22DRAFT_1409577 [Trametopsis cervina]
MTQISQDTSSLAPTAAPTLEVHHVSSNSNLTATPRENRLSKSTSQHLRTHRIGSKSPSSIPSSPTSVHSSSSAIFERDIEPLTPSPPMLGHTNDPHRMPRGKLTEQLDQSVPTVLDSAAEALILDIDDKEAMESIAIVAPVPFEFPGGSSGFTSPISQLSSRSPSPNGTSNRRSVLVNLPSPSPSFTLPLPLQSQNSQGVSGFGASPARPSVQTSSSPPAPPSIISSAPASEDSSPTTATHHDHPLHSLSGNASPGGSTPTANATLSSHAPPSPNGPSKRLSFISYTDLLTSAPASTMPLSSLTLSAQANEPPPHLPSVIGIPQAQAQGQASSAASIHSSVSAAAWVTERDPTADLVSDQGGEWGREGLGRGLEERLEALMSLEAHAPTHVTASNKA